MAKKAAVLKPAAEGGSVNHKGEAIEDLAIRFVDLEADKNELEDKVKDLKKKIAEVETMLVDRMAESQTQKISVKGRTVFLQKNTIVNRAKGVLAEDFIEILRECGFGDLVGETVSAQTLKAVVKERIEKAAEQGVKDFAYFCESCDSFLLVEKSPKGCKCSACKKPMVPTIKGIPDRVFPLLFIEPKYELGNRAS